VPVTVVRSCFTPASNMMLKNSIVWLPAHLMVLAGPAPATGLCVQLPAPYRPCRPRRNTPASRVLLCPHAMSALRACCHASLPAAPPASPRTCRCYTAPRACRCHYGSLPAPASSIAPRACMQRCHGHWSSGPALLLCTAVEFPSLHHPRLLRTTYSLLLIILPSYF